MASLARFRNALPALSFVAVLANLPAAAQQQGVSHPELLDDPIATTQPLPQPAPVQAEHYQPRSQAVQPATEPTLQPRVEAAPPAVSSYAPAQPMPAQAHAAEVFNPNDPSNGIVTEAPYIPGQLIDGTVLRARLLQTLSTRNTAEGTVFTARLIADVSQRGEVLIPAGSLIHGRVTEVHGGKRIGGPAMIRLTPTEVELPTGAILHLSAEVVGLDEFDNSRVNQEGVIVDRTDARVTAAQFGLTTAGAAAAGAVIGGGVGFVVGALAGAGVGTVIWLKQDHQETLPEGTQIVFCLQHPLQIDTASLR